VSSFADRVRKLHAMMGSTNPNESKAALEMLHKLLKQKGKSWNDLPEFLSDPDGGLFSTPRYDDDSDLPPENETPELTAIIQRLLERYLYLTEKSHYLAMALWIIHTHIFGRFQFSPRLVLESPVRGCGKTTALSILELLCESKEARPYNSRFLISYHRSGPHRAA
jgi:hypothetical protein